MSWAVATGTVAGADEVVGEGFAEAVAPSTLGLILGTVWELFNRRLAFSRAPVFAIDPEDECRVELPVPVSE